MKLLHGIDVVSIERLRGVMGRQGEHFEKRVFGETERRYCREKHDPIPHFAARFAAKEAYGKALGLGLGPSGGFSEIEVVNDAEGVPSLRLSGAAKKVFEEHGGGQIALSLTHDGDVAMASVIIFR